MIHYSFRVVGLLGAALTLIGLMAAGLRTHPLHAVLVSVIGVSVTLLMGTWADGVVAARGASHASWLGPLCAEVVLLSGALAIVGANAEWLIDDPESYVLRPLVAVAFYGSPVALLAGLLCGGVVYGLHVAARAVQERRVAGDGAWDVYAPPEK